MTKVDTTKITEIIWERVTNAGDPDGPILKADCEQAAQEILALIPEDDVCIHFDLTIKPKDFICPYCKRNKVLREVRRAMGE